MTYNGHKNWAHWNVALWIGNDEGLYRLACDAVKTTTSRKRAALKLVRYLPARTPDGARYSIAAVYAALDDWR